MSARGELDKARFDNDTVEVKECFVTGLRWKVKVDGGVMVLQVDFCSRDVLVGEGSHKKNTLTDHDYDSLFVSKC